MRIVPGGPWKFLDPRSGDAVAFDGFRNGGRFQNQSIDIGAGEYSAQGFQDLLSSTHSNQPVVDQRDSQVFERDSDIHCPTIVQPSKEISPTKGGTTGGFGVVPPDSTTF